MKSIGIGQTLAERFFIQKFNDRTLSIDIDGVVFNSKTQRYIGATGSGRYPKISMKNMDDGIIYHIQIHRLLWIIYKGDIPIGLEINHKDLNKENRKLSNLELTTSKGNSRHFVESDKFKSLPGESNGNSKLLDEDVIRMRIEYKEGKHTMAYYAKKYNVHEATISGAINKKHYFNV